MMDKLVNDDIPNIRFNVAKSYAVLIDTLKQRVPIWKREHYTDGDRVWIDPTRASDSPA